MHMPLWRQRLTSRLLANPARSRGVWVCCRLFDITTRLLVRTTNCCLFPGTSRCQVQREIWFALHESMLARRKRVGMVSLCHLCSHYFKFLLFSPLSQFCVAYAQLITSIGRNNWNIPKHLARFAFTETGNSLTVEVSPQSENSPPFFRVNLAPFRYLPAIPFSTNMSKYIGMDLRLAQPPLPAAKTANDGIQSTTDDAYLCGTETWKIAVPEIWGNAKCCWIDHSPLLEKPDETSPLLNSAQGAPNALLPIDANTWWPAYSPWKVGLWLENGKINFNDGEEKGLGSHM
jgi:hypothetical protein